MLSFDLRVENLLNAQVSGSGSNSSELDVEQYLGNIFIQVAARSGGTNTMSIAVEHSDTSGSGFVAVPASALFNHLTGAAATFDDVTTSETDQTLALNRQQLRRYVRVALTGSTLTQEVSVNSVSQPQMTEEA